MVLDSTRARFALRDNREDGNDGYHCPVSAVLTIWARIKLLEPCEAQKIAAGEVVERPAHTVKELLENALDAGATKVTLYIEKSGKQSIRVVDNGCGMSADDAQLCFARHATSKVTCLDDLMSLTSFGFRGEALASIASVSNVTLVTRRGGDELGTKISCHGGRLGESVAISCPVGTDLAVADLFCTVPARKKFLKADDTEWNQIAAVFHAFCLSNRSVHFQVYRDGKMVLNAPPVSRVSDRICQLWETNTAHNMIDVVPAEDKRVSWCTLSGVISNHHFWRYNRSLFFFFVNGRWVKDVELGKALMKGYQNVLPPGKCPAGFIFIQVDPELVDINVHPKKEEVRFTKPGTVANILQRSVIQTLEQQVNKNISQSAYVRTGAPDVAPVDTSPAMSPRSQDLPPQIFMPSSTSNVSSSPRISGETAFVSPPDASRTQVVSSSDTGSDLEEQQTAVCPNQDDSFAPAIIGQLFDTYILLQNDDSFTIIDQHAAHERILYEKFRGAFSQREGTVLLFPLVITLDDPITLEKLLAEKSFFSQHGIGFEQFGARELAIKSCPPDLTDHNLKELIQECADVIHDAAELDSEAFRKKLHEHVHSHLACKTAIKAGDVLDHDQMATLVATLHKTDNRYICIHGRPTSWTLSKNEIGKKFRRK